MRALVTALLVLASCKKTQESPKAPRSDAAVPIAAVDAAAPAPVRTACATEPKGGIAIPASAKATDVRVASTGSKAFVTWFESPFQKELGRPTDFAIGHVFDGSAVGPRIQIQADTYSNDPISGAAPVVVGDELFAITCDYFAPSGWFLCGKGAPGAKSVPFFTFTGIGGGGPDVPGIAAVVGATDTAIFVPGSASDVLVFTASVSGKKKAHPFSFREHAPHADAVVAVGTGPDEATVLYRANGAIFARRAGFDEVWRGKPTTLSTARSQVGAPAIATDGSHVVALFSERAAASDPWHVAMSDLATTTALSLGDQAQGPGIAARGTCFLVTWVEGSGKTTRTRLGQLCDGTVDPTSMVTLSTDGVEGGRAYPTHDFIVWQELPAGGPAELRIARLVCP